MLPAHGLGLTKSSLLEKERPGQGGEPYLAWIYGKNSEG
jgi:hypothetical protein